jgi:membrane protein required for colicin V production
MNLFDVILILILAYCFIRGIFRGLLKEISSLIGVLGGFYAAYTYYREAGVYLKRWISDPNYINILSFLIIFLSVFLIVSIIGIIIKYILKIVFLGWVDRVFGGIFGILKGILIGSVLLIVFTAFLSGDSTMIRNSRISPYISTISDAMVRVTPKELKYAYQAKKLDIENAWKKSK